MKNGKRTAYAISMVALVLGLASAQLSTMLMQQSAYAHVFPGNESAAFIATLGVLTTENRLINNTVATNSSEANEHAKIALEHWSANDTSEMAERNQRIATDLPKTLNALQNMTVNLAPTNTTGIAAVRQSVSDLDGLLGEALSVRVEPTQLANATVYGTAVADLLNETLERYSEALGIGENTTTASNTANTSATNVNAMAIVKNLADYASTKGLANTTMETFNKTKTLANTTNPTVLSKIDNDLIQLRNSIDNKTSYAMVATYVYNMIYPDLNSALNLGLAKVDANKAIQDTMSGTG